MMPVRVRRVRKQIVALTVRQWLPSWSRVVFSPENYRSQPPTFFLLLSVEASELRRLVGIRRRSGKGLRAEDRGIQRVHERERSQEIAEYIQHGFPWSGVSKQRRAQTEFTNLIKPGWLPSAVILNILGAEDLRKGMKVHPADRIDIQINGDGTATVDMPVTDSPDWALSGLPPFEIIDGQHRLFAFDELEADYSDYQLPVVAFCGLDRSWQAYLFYTINIKPKRINPSLAFDLYPLLRTEDWLQKFSGLNVYREARAQELTEALWLHEFSPWYQRVNMIGQKKVKMVRQASWVRSLQATMVKPWENRRFGIGGLFGSAELPWSRAQQAGFLIFSWQKLASAIAECDAAWAQHLRKIESVALPTDPAFTGENTLLNADMGVRGYLYVLNDLCYVLADLLELKSWDSEDYAPATDADAVSDAIVTLHNQKVGSLLQQLSENLATYDWRSSKTPGLSEAERQAKARFRGGTGYREMRRDLLMHLARCDESTLRSASRRVIQLLGYDS